MLVFVYMLNACCGLITHRMIFDYWGIVKYLL